MAKRQRLESIEVGKVFEDNKNRLQLVLLNDNYNLSRKITEADFHRPGLGLAGYTDVFTFWRIQILGNTEIRYLNKLSVEERLQRIRYLMGYEIPCMIVTNKNVPPAELLQLANEYQLAVFGSALATTRCVHLLSVYMDFKFAPYEAVYGTLVDVLGIGMLIIGRSGIGKSEVALDLIERGHRLVADDIVHIHQHAGDVLMGRAKDLLRNHMEIRGLGIIDVRRLYGIHSVRLQKRVEVVIQLEDWKAGEEYDRTGLDQKTFRILDTELPLVRLPIFPGKNITVIVETIALNMILRSYGENPAKELNERLIQRMQEPQVREDLLIGDFE